MSVHLDPASPLEGALLLRDWAVFTAQGADAASFLQGQLTQDVAGLPQGAVRLSGYCSAKGRLLASLLVWRIDAETFGLLVGSDVAAPFLKRLSMYVLRARCRLQDVTSQWSVHGLAGAASISRALDGGSAAPGRAASHQGGWVLGLAAAEGVARALWLRSAQSPVPDLPALQPALWAWLEVSSGVPRITAPTVEQFVPQMINFERVGGVDFQKGCYPGQEVVARSQYRGTLKRRMHLFATDGEAAPGQEVFHSGDPSQPAGMVVNSAMLPSAGTRLLAEVKIAALDSGSLHLGSAQGPALQRLSLPYPIADTVDV
jgi:folate-binding protein YgfZ